MDRRFLTVLGVSLVFALVVSSVFYQMTARSNGPRKTEVTDMRDLVVTTRPLSVGGTLKPADVKIVKIAAAAFPKGAYSKVEEVLDRPVISNILMEEPILEGRLGGQGQRIWVWRRPSRWACAPSRCASTTSPTWPASCCRACTSTCW